MNIVLSFLIQLLQMPNLRMGAGNASRDLLSQQGRRLARIEHYTCSKRSIPQNLVVSQSLMIVSFDIHTVILKALLAAIIYQSHWPHNLHCIKMQPTFPTRRTRGLPRPYILQEK